MNVLHIVTLILNVLTCTGQTLVMHVVEVISDQDVTLHCNISSSTTLTRWTYVAGLTGTSLMSYQNGQCTVSPSDSFLSDRSRYLYACNSTSHQVTIHYYGHRNLNNHILACTKTEQPDESGSTWMFKIISDGEQCNCDSTITFSEKEITEGNSVTFICRVSSDVTFVNWDRNIGSNTSAMAVQNDQCTTQGTTFLDDTSKYIYTCNKTVYQVTRMNVQRSEHNDMYMCTPIYQTERKGLNWIIKVKAPVTSVTMIPTDNILNVIENTTVEITCTTSTARPAASVYWYIHPNGNSNDVTQITENITATTDYNDLSVITSTVHFVLRRQHNNTMIYCTANNSVNTSPLRSNQKILLNVLFKADDPYISQGPKYRVLENTQGTLSCIVKGGNPAPTISWSCNNFSPADRSTIINNGNLEVTLTWNVSRTHEGTCTCTSTQTNFTTETIKVSVVVVYEVSILSFSINGHTNKIVTVNEGSSVIFICTTDGNALPAMTLTNGTNVLVSRTSPQLEYNLSQVTCQDIGTYSCSAQYEPNVHKDVSSLDLIVHCSPRPIGDMNEEILSGIGKSVQINIEVIAYPIPSFTWWSQVNDQWKMIQTTDRRLINSSGLLSFLTIDNVNEDDFTSYKVIVKNSVGEMEHIYELHDGSPDMPTQLQYFETLSTSSSIQLAWDPGYNGGSTQIFYIKYKSTNETSWKYQTVSDDLEQTRIYTLTNLKDNMYYYIKILASNQYGNSSESSLLIANTKEKETTEPPTKESSNLSFMVGGIVGGLIALVAVLSVVFILIRRIMSSKGCIKQPSQQTESTKEITNEAPANTQYDDIERDNEYEMINQSSSLSRPYSSLQEKDSITQAESNRENTYENTI